MLALSVLAQAFVRPVPSAPEAIHLLGGRIAVISGDRGDDLMTLLDHTVPAAAPGPAWHVHKTCSEWFYVVEGRFAFEVAGVVQEAGPGTYVHVPRGAAHRWWNPTPEPARMLVGYSRPGMHRYFEEMRNFLRGEAGSTPDPARLLALQARWDSLPAGDEV